MSLLRQIKHNQPSRLYLQGRKGQVDSTTHPSASWRAAGGGIFPGE